MSYTSASQQRNELLHSYEMAMVAFGAASAILIDHLAAESLPTEEQIVRERNARAAAVSARRQLSAVSPTCGHPILQRS
jgi:hypothetical protein